MVALIENFKNDSWPLQLQADHLPGKIWRTELIEPPIELRSVLSTDERRIENYVADLTVLLFDHDAFGNYSLFLQDKTRHEKLEELQELYLEKEEGGTQPKQRTITNRTLNAVGFNKGHIAGLHVSEQDDHLVVRLTLKQKASTEDQSEIEDESKAPSDPATPGAAAQSALAALPGTELAQANDLLRQLNEIAEKLLKLIGLDSEVK